MLELIEHAQMHLIKAHASVAKARLSIFPKQDGPRSGFLLDPNRWYIVYLKIFFLKSKI